TMENDPYGSPNNHLKILMTTLKELMGSQIDFFASIGATCLIFRARPARYSAPPETTSRV
ncbi:MAG: hypothetical protein ACK2UU_13480, partial [Anaerolineae bacterium]